MKNILIVGATRNLGAHLARFYSKQPNTAVYATARYAQPEFHGPNIHWISNVDITEERAGAKIAAHYSGDSHIDVVIFVATSSSALYEPENIHHVNFKRELRMYETTAMGPVFVTHHLVISKLIKRGTKIIMVGNKAGSITLQGKGRLGGDYGYHGANAALNMVGRIRGHCCGDHTPRPSQTRRRKPRSQTASNKRNPNFAERSYRQIG